MGQQIAAIVVPERKISTPEKDLLVERRNHILFNELTVLEKEVAKERQLDIDYPDWRDDEEDEANLVTNRQGEVELNPDQAAWFQRQQEKKTQSQGLGW